MIISSHLGSAILETPLKICGSQLVICFGRKGNALKRVPHLYVDDEQSPFLDQTIFMVDLRTLLTAVVVVAAKLS